MVGGISGASVVPGPKSIGMPPCGTAVTVVIWSDPLSVSVAEHTILLPVSTQIRVPGQQYNELIGQMV